MLQGFCAGEQFDGQQILRKLDDRSQFQGCGHSHGNMIFLSTRGGHVINTGRMRQNSRFIEQRSRGDVWNHET